MDRNPTPTLLSRKHVSIHTYSQGRRRCEIFLLLRPSLILRAILSKLNFNVCNNYFFKIVLFSGRHSFFFFFSAVIDDVKRNEYSHYLCPEHTALPFTSLRSGLNRDPFFFLFFRLPTGNYPIHNRNIRSI